MNLLGSLQKVGKALMTPIAVLPAAALLLRFGQPDLLNIKVMADAGDVIFGNLPLLFAIGVAIGLAEDAGVSALSATIGYFVFTKVLTDINSKLNMGVLAGILIGVLASWCYKRFKTTKLPDYLGFFGGRRFVPIVTAFFALALGIIFGYVWPPVQQLISSVGTWIVGAGALGYAIYAILNRLLLPFGLHHILNSMVWFVFGDYTDAAGKVVHGDLTRFFAHDPGAGNFMAGFFPVMMFGLVGAALAMYQEAKPARKKVIGGIMLSAALTSFLTGITEPIEFAFMFLSPVLYAIHALLSALSFVVMSTLGVKLGFGFSAGLIDYVLNYGLSTQPLLLIPVGLVFGVVYWAAFRFVIRLWNLKTPGREDDEDETVAA